MKIVVLVTSCAALFATPRGLEEGTNSNHLRNRRAIDKDSINLLRKSLRLGLTEILFVKLDSLKLIDRNPLSDNDLQKSHAQGLTLRITGNPSHKQIYVRDYY